MKVSTFTAALVIGMAVTAAAGAHDALSATTREVVAQSHAISIRAEVVAVDRAGNTMTVLGPMGNLVQMPLVTSQRPGMLVAVGDKIDMQYKDAVAVDVQKLDGSSNGIRKRVDTGVLVPRTHGYDVAHQVEVEATVQAVDLKDRRLKLRGPYQPVTVEVAKGVDMEHVRPGDTVRLVFVSTYAVSGVRG